MAELCRRHAIEYDSAEKLGITYKDIRQALTSMKGGRRLGSLLDDLMHQRKAPDVDASMAYFGLKLVPEHPLKDGEENDGWLGVNLSTKDGRVKVTSHLSGSPVRQHVMPGDEIVAIDGIRTASLKGLKRLSKAKQDNKSNLCQVMKESFNRIRFNPLPSPQHGVKLDGKRQFQMELLYRNTSV